jgi:hypothetical protein
LAASICSITFAIEAGVDVGRGVAGAGVVVRWAAAVAGGDAIEGADDGVGVEAPTTLVVSVHETTRIETAISRSIVRTLPAKRRERRILGAGALTGSRPGR